jgi:hypothetical protein
LAFSFAIPVLIIPTIGVLLFVFLERLGLTLLGKVIALVALAAIAKLSLAGLIWMNSG